MIRCRTQGQTGDDRTPRALVLETLWDCGAAARPYLEEARGKKLAPRVAKAVEGFLVKLKAR